jgi:DNA repair photolyase
MIINASGRTDVVAYYMDWFVNRWKEGYFDVRNPFNPKLVSRIFVSDVDMIVFCTKNPLPLLDTIHLFSVPIQLQVTITGYFKDMEPNVLDKKQVIECIKKLSSYLGKENVCVRYDPILLNSKYNVDYHVRAFNKLCTMLKGYVSKMIVSFVDDYKNVRNNHLDYHEPSNEEYLKLKEEFEKNDIKIISCMENKYQIGDEKDCCVSIKYVFERTGKLFKEWKARDCHCVNMVDVGAYNSCLHGCKYCYANFDSKQIVSNYKMHDVNSSLLIGQLNLDDQIKIRRK